MVRWALTLTAVVALAVPGAAMAKTGKWSYDGTVNLDPDSAVSFDVVRSKRGGKKVVRNAVIENAFAGCGGVISQISTPIADKGTLRKGRKGFKLKSTGPLQTLKVKGNITARGREAYGSFQLKGSFLVDGVTRSCDTGPRGWTATLTSGP